MPLIVQIVGYKNTGKTTLVCRLTECFKTAGYKVGTIKRDAHDFQMDTPGTDTWKHQQAGADFTAITSAKRTAIIKQHAESLEQIIEQMSGAEVILIEGFKDASYPKIMMIRSLADIELLQNLTNLLAIAVWPEFSTSLIDHFPIPVISINETEQLFQKVKSLPRSS